MKPRASDVQRVSLLATCTRAAGLQKRTGAQWASRTKKAVSAALLFKRVSMNGLVSHLPNERAESGAHHPLAQVKRAVHSTPKGLVQSTGGAEKGSVDFSLDDTAALTGSRIDACCGASRLCADDVRVPRHATPLLQRGVFTVRIRPVTGRQQTTTSGSGPSARARTPNVDAVVSSTAPA